MVFVGVTGLFNMHCGERWRCRPADQFVVGRLTLSLVARCQVPKAKGQRPKAKSQKPKAKSQKPKANSEDKKSRQEKS